jgi:hypothetical protein
MGKKSPSVADNTEIGESKTCQWFMGAVDKGTTLGFYFEPSDAAPAPVSPEQSAIRQSFVQFQTVYHHPSG